MPQIAPASVDGGANKPGHSEADGEVVLDIEVAGAVAPGAKIVVYFAPNTSNGFIDAVKAATRVLGTDRPHVLREAILACRKGGRVSIPGVYGGFADKFPIGALMEKGLSVKTGQTHVQRYADQLLDMIGEGRLDTTFVISDRLPLEQAPSGYKMFKERQNEVTKVVLKTAAAHASVN